MRTIAMVNIGRLSRWIIVIAGILMILTVATSTYGVSSQLLTPAMNQSGGLCNVELSLGESANQSIPLGVTCSSFTGTETGRVVHGSTIEIKFKNLVLKDLSFD